MVPPGAAPPVALSLEEASAAKRALALLKYRAVCICNTIRYPRVQQAIDAGATTVEEVARVTGCTTGECAGERCKPVILEMLRRASGGVRS
ncbi:MAG: (2Fe-2S)-binding protein [Thermoanaerobaculia bacterium]